MTLSIILPLALAVSMLGVGCIAVAGDRAPDRYACIFGGAFFAGASACLFIAVWEIVT